MGHQNEYHNANTLYHIQNIGLFDLENVGLHTKFVFLV